MNQKNGRFKPTKLKSSKLIIQNAFFFHLESSEKKIIFRMIATFSSLSAFIIWYFIFFWENSFRYSKQSPHLHINTEPTFSNVITKVGCSAYQLFLSNATIKSKYLHSVFPMHYKPPPIEVTKMKFIYLNCVLNSQNGYNE